MLPLPGQHIVHPLPQRQTQGQTLLFVLEENCYSSDRTEVTRNQSIASEKSVPVNTRLLSRQQDPLLASTSNSLPPQQVTPGKDQSPALLLSLQRMVTNMNCSDCVRHPCSARTSTTTPHGARTRWPHGECRRAALAEGQAWCFQAQ